MSVTDYILLCIEWELYIGKMLTNLLRVHRHDKWIIQKVARSYLEAFEHSKENLVCLTLIVSSCTP